MRDLFGFSTRSGKRIGVFFKDAPSPPPAPNYAAAAQQTAIGNLEATRAAAKANRINQITPYGSLTYSQSGSDPDAGWTQTLSLSPEQQQLLKAQNQTSLGLAGLQNQGLSYVRDALAKNITMGDLPASMVNAGQTGQDAIMARVRPEMDRQRAGLQTQLANQGIPLGSEAYENAMRIQGQRENDAMMQAGLYGIDVGQKAQTQQLGLLSALQDRPINVLNAVRTGSQVTNPAFQAFAQQQGTSGPDLLGAAGLQGQYNQGLFNAQTGAYNANGGWLGPIGSAAVNLGSAALMGR
jgi:hypothetical protein